MNGAPDYMEQSIVPVPVSTPRNSLEDLINDKVPQLEQIEQTEDVKPETVEIANKKAVLRHVKPQEVKYWHFKFIDSRNTNQLTNVLQNIQGYRLTVEYGTPVNTADISLKSDGEVVGKIHLLLCDRRDANLPNKYYVKLYFYQFKNNQLLQAVKTALVNFFENFKGVAKKEPSLRRKPSLTRRSSLGKRSSLNKRKSLIKRSLTKRKRVTRRPRQ